MEMEMAMSWVGYRFGGRDVVGLMIEKTIVMSDLSADKCTVS